MVYNVFTSSVPAGAKSYEVVPVYELKETTIDDNTYNYIDLPIPSTGLPKRIFVSMGSPIEGESLKFFGRGVSEYNYYDGMNTNAFYYDEELSLWILETFSSGDEAH